jgi:20S proteasome alpha/beta subunit
MRIIIVLFLCCIPHDSPNGNSYGTLIASFIGKNGIVVSADSRTVLYNAKGKVVAYFEETSKIFQIRNFLIAVAGQYTFDTTGIEELIRGISASRSLPDIDLYSLHDSLLGYAKTRLSTHEYFSLYNNQFIISGYYHNTPTILYYDGFKRPAVSISAIGLSLCINLNFCTFIAKGNKALFVSGYFTPTI